MPDKLCSFCSSPAAREGIIKKRLLIISGLTEEEMIVTAGVHQLEKGQRVKPLKEE